MTIIAAWKTPIIILLGLVAILLPRLGAQPLTPNNLVGCWQAKIQGCDRLVLLVGYHKSTFRCTNLRGAEPHAWGVTVRQNQSGNIKITDSGGSELNCRYDSTQNTLICRSNASDTLEVFSRLACHNPAAAGRVGRSE